MELNEIVEVPNPQLNKSSTLVSVTPKLTKRERKALLASNKSFEKSLKNVIANPYHAHWPLVTSNTDELFRLLAGPLAKCCLKSVKLPLVSIKDKSKEERLEARKKAKEIFGPKDETCALRSLLAIGVNAASRALERQEVEAVLITSDVEPRLMAQHLVQLAVRQAAVIVIHGLRQFAQQNLGVKTCVLAFKKSSPSEFSAAIDEIKHLATTVKVPFNLPNKMEAKIQEEVQDSNADEVQKWQCRQVKNWHLSKPATGETAFHIERVNETTLKTKQDDEFIPLGGNDLLELNSDSYCPLYVKRCKPNSDKVCQKKSKRKRK